MTQHVGAVAQPSAASPESRTRQRRVLNNVAVYAGQRLLFGLLVLLTIIFLSHFGLELARGSALHEALVDAVRKTATYLVQLARGDPGLTAAGSLTLRPIPIADVVGTTLFKSLGLLATSLSIATIVGVGLGLWAAGQRHSSWSVGALLISIVGVSVPSFFAAFVLQMVVVRWGQAVGTTVLPVGGFGWDTHLILPALVLAARPIAQIFRVTFISLGDVLDQDYVRTAHSKGLKPHQIMRRHIIRNALIPVLTTIGTSLRFSLSSLPVVEYFFGWAGVGFTLLKAISHQDDNLTVALALSLGAVFILVNLVLEISYRLIDPRLRQATARVAQAEPESLRERLSSLAGDLHDLAVHNPVRGWIARRRAEPSASPFRAVVARKSAASVTAEDLRAERRRAWARAILSNLPLLAGSVLVAGLLAIIVFGPRLAPHSPYTTSRGLVYRDGEFIMPPFEPDDTYPWGTDVIGRDIMSLILAGAQQTLLLATVLVSARMLVGFTLGALAGWFSGSWLDRLLMATAETIAAFPTLLIAMILILGLGIRQGIRPFLIALTFVGWGEIMQFVRGEVMAIRPKPFVESAVAVGLRSSRIVVSHVLPNLIPVLISIAALEMGAVLMLLGELGFIGIFIGGGAFADLQWLAPPFHYSDVPEWGALLSNMRTYARSYPWMAAYPALAFFLAILAFNLFGEGLRRLVEGVGLGIGRIVNRYTVGLAALALLSLGWVRGNTGALAFYRLRAGTFEGERALAHVVALADPALGGRALGTPGMDRAADYIAQQFQNLGLQAGGEEFTYFQTRSRSYEKLDAIPQLAIEDGGPPLTYRQDYAEFAGYYRTLGDARSPVRFFATGDLTTAQFGDYPALKGLDFHDVILLLPSRREAAYIYRRPHELPRDGVLVVAEDEAVLKQAHTLSPRDFVTDLAGEQVREDVPILWISEVTADRILAGTGHTLAELDRRAEKLTVNELFELPTGVTASMDVQGTVSEKVSVRHVIGHLPGLAGHIEGAPEADAAKLDQRLIVVLAQYDSPPSPPDELPYPAANDNASGVAVMLEAIRTLRDTGYRPYRTFLFIAYSGEGLEPGGEVSPRDVATFLQAKRGFDNFEVEAVIELRGLGSGRGNGVAISAGGSRRLANVLEKAAGLMGVNANRVGENMDISIVFEDIEMEEGGQAVPSAGLHWSGWEATSLQPTDTLATISATKLKRAGQVLTAALMILGRELQY